MRKGFIPILATVCIGAVISVADYTIPVVESDGGASESVIQNAATNVVGGSNVTVAVSGQTYTVTASNLEYVPSTATNNYDRQVGDYTTDNGYYEWDLTAENAVPSNAVMVRLIGTLVDDAANNFFMFVVKDKEGQLRHQYIARSQAANVAYDWQFDVPIASGNTNAVILYRGANTTFTSLNTTIAGYWIKQ